MAGGSGGAGRTLEETPTWAVAVVCFVLVLISIFIEHIIHLIGKWLTRKNKKALYEALEKIKSELMLLGFISLLLTVGADPISRICIPQKVADSWHPCNTSEKAKLGGDDKKKGTKTSDQEGGGDSSEDLTVTIGRRLLHIFNNMEYANDDPIPSHRRVLAGGGGGGGGDKCSAKGKVPLISGVGINQLHIFIFVLAVTHVLYCIITLILGRLKMRSWKSWENETKTVEYEFTNDPERFRFARDTSFGRRHLHFWSKSPILIWIVCFFRQFVRSVPKVDYLTLRHGFIMAHLAPQGATKFDFQKYINRSLEDDFKVVVGISPPIWFFAVLFLLFNTHGWYSYLWLPFIPLILILLVGTKLQVIITRMGLRIHDRGDVVKGVLTVKPADDLFWFSRPRLMLYIINFVLFQNAFQLAFFVWTWYEFGFRSCFHKRLEDIIIRISMGVLIQILCSYVTLPLYALVTQMGSTMKPTIFHDRVATALKKWHHTARKHIKQQNSRAVTPVSSRPGTPMSSRPGTPLHGFSPVHLLKNHRSEMDFQNSPTARFSNTDYNNDQWDYDQGSPIHHRQGEGSSSHHQNQFSRTSGQEQQQQQHEMKDISDMSLSDIPITHPVLPRIVTNTTGIQHEIDIRTDSTDPRREIKNGSVGFSFAKR